MSNVGIALRSELPNWYIKMVAKEASRLGRPLTKAEAHKIALKGRKRYEKLDRTESKYMR